MTRKSTETTINAYIVIDVIVTQEQDKKAVLSQRRPRDAPTKVNKQPVPHLH